MKSVFATTFVLVMGLSQIAKTAEIEIPAEIASSSAAVSAAEDFAVKQAAEIVMIETQIKFYQILKMSFEGSRQVSDMFENDVLNTGSSAAATGVTVAANYKLIQKWLSGAQPSAALVKEAWNLSRGDMGKVRASVLRVYESLKVMTKQMSVPAKFAGTAAIGMFAYVEYETFWVINMSEAQYDALMANLNQTIKALEAKQHAMADRHTPFVLN